jgi:hypothetical protein
LKARGLHRKEKGLIVIIFELRNTQAQIRQNGGASVVVGDGGAWLGAT